jgi:hypothetical protein
MLVPMLRGSERLAARVFFATTFSFLDMYVKRRMRRRKRGGKRREGEVAGPVLSRAVAVAGCAEAAVQGQGYVDLGGYELSDEEDHHQLGSVWLRDQAD